jgi:cell division inhibitor SulA
LPSLAQHSHQGRWLTLVAPPSAIHRPSLVKARINLSAMRVIRHNVIKDYWAAVELCLQQGNSSVVIAWTDQRFCDALRAQLKAAALAGHCTLIVMRQLGNSASTATMDNVEVASGPQLSLAF